MPKTPAKTGNHNRKRPKTDKKKTASPVFGFGAASSRLSVPQRTSTSAPSSSSSTPLPTPTGTMTRTTRRGEQPESSQDDQAANAQAMDTDQAGPSGTAGTSSGPQGQPGADGAQNRGPTGTGRDGVPVDRLYNFTIERRDDVVPAEMRGAITAMVELLTKDVDKSGGAVELVGRWKSDLREFAGAVSYIGLDVPAMRRALLYYAQQMDVVYQRPLFLAIALGLTRGNNVDRIRDTVTPQLRSAIDQMVQGLKISAKTNKNPSTITLARIMVCFPDLTALIAAEIKPLGIVRDIAEGYPFPMRNASFSSLIPRSARASQSTDRSVIESLKKAQILYQAKTSMTIDRRVKRLDSALVEKQKVFVYTGIEQGTNSDAHRWAFIERPEMGVFINGTLNPAILEAVNELNEIKTSTM